MSTMLTRITVAVVTVASVWVTVPHQTPPRPCVAEDGPGPCFWDAGRRGNHRGFSFWIDSRQHTHYLDPRGGQR